MLALDGEILVEAARLAALESIKRCFMETAVLSRSVSSCSPASCPRKRVRSGSGSKSSWNPRPSHQSWEFCEDACRDAQAAVAAVLLSQRFWFETERHSVILLCSAHAESSSSSASAKGAGLM